MSISAIGQSLFNSARSTYLSAPREGKLLAGNGAVNMAIGQPGIIENLLNIAGIASLFVPTLMPFVAALCLARSGLDFAKALSCLVRGDIGGCIANVTTGVINGFCAMPQLKGLKNIVKVGALEKTNMGVEGVKKYTTQTLRTKMQNSKQLVQDISDGLKKDLGDVEKSIRGVGSELKIKGAVAKEGVEEIGIDDLIEQIDKKPVYKISREKSNGRLTKLKERFDRLDDIAKQKASEAAKENAEEAVKTVAEDARKSADKASKAYDTAKTAIEKAKKKRELMDELKAKRREIKQAQENIEPMMKSATQNLQRVENAIKGSETEQDMAGLSQSLDLKGNPLEIVEINYQRYIKDLANRAYTHNGVNHAGTFNSYVDKGFDIYRNPEKVKASLKDVHDRAKNGFQNVAPRNTGLIEPPPPGFMKYEFRGGIYQPTCPESIIERIIVERAA